MNQNILTPHDKFPYELRSDCEDRNAPFKYKREDRQVPSEQSSQLLEEAAHTFSIAVTANDVRDAVRILKKRTDGVSLAEATDAFKKRILNPQKTAVYEYWGIVTRNGDRLGLSPLGCELARRIEPEVSVFRSILDSIHLYRSVLFWMHKHCFDRITHPDVIAYWTENCASIMRACRQDTIKMDAICFFHLCQAAELGTVTLGKRGQPARLLVDREELEKYLRDDHCSLDLIANETGEMNAAKHPLLSKLSNRATNVSPGVYISCSYKSPVIEQVQATLNLAEFESEVIERGEFGAAILPETMRLAMRSSVAGIIILTAHDCRRDEAGDDRLNEAVTMEIGAARALYDDRVVLLREKRIVIPCSLIDLIQCEFQSNSLSWESGVQLMQKIKAWKSSDSR